MLIGGSILGVIWFGLLVYALYDVASSKAITRTRKLAWVLIVVILPFIGVFLYLIEKVGGFGRSPAAGVDRFEGEIERDRLRGF
jgi:Phospholipase_D-nuclease N-terminal